MFFALIVLLLSLGLEFQEIQCAYPITFVDHKNKQGALDQALLKTLVDTFGFTLFIETGTYNGETTAQAAPLFKKIHTIELDQRMVEAAQRRFASQKHITVHHGSSPDIFMNILPSLQNEGPILFFLDAHYSGPGTAMGNEGSSSPDGLTAVRKELNAIKQNNIKNCAIMIDDVCVFGSTINNKEYHGEWAYPSMQEVCKELLEINSNFSITLIGDILLAFDKTKNNLPISPIAQACTISRLFDGSNYTENELLEAEKNIGTAQGKEKELITTLYKVLANDHNLEFHYDVWYGLICLHEQKSNEALHAFNSVVNRGYNHWRINEYTKQAKNII